MSLIVTLMCNVQLVDSYLALSVLMRLHKNDAIMLQVNVMHELKASAPCIKTHGSRSE